MTASNDVQAMLKYSTRRPARVQRTRSGPALVATSGVTVLTIKPLSYRIGLQEFYTQINQTFDFQFRHADLRGRNARDYSLARFNSASFSSARRTADFPPLPSASSFC